MSNHNKLGPLKLSPLSVDSIDLGGDIDEQDSGTEPFKISRSYSSKALISACFPLRTAVSPLRYSSAPFDYPTNNQENRQAKLNKNMFQPSTISSAFDTDKLKAFRNWIYCISIVNFDLNVGQVLEFTYPQEDFGPDEVKKM